MTSLRRRFVDLPHGQLHYWHGGLTGLGSARVPLLMLHAAPGSARILLPLAEALASHREVIALDLPGMGDSEPLPISGEPEISDYTAIVQAALAVLGVSRCDVYGTLSGSRVALDLARGSLPHVRALVLDGIGIPKPEQLPELLQRYVPALEPDWYGGQFQKVWHLVRDQYLYYPWYARDRAHRRDVDLPSPRQLHLKAMEVLKSAHGFGPLVRAAFRYPVESVLRGLKLPMLLSADGHGLVNGAELLSQAAAEPINASPEALEARAVHIHHFLERVGHAGS